MHIKTCRLPIQKFLRNLKFRYLEQAAKKKYVVEIMSEEGPAISAAGNEELKTKNEEKKKALRIVKDKLSEKQKDIRDLAPLVEEGSVPSLFWVVYDPDAQSHGLRLRESQNCHSRNIIPLPADPGCTLGTYEVQTTPPRTKVDRLFCVCSTRFADHKDARICR